MNIEEYNGSTNKIIKILAKFFSVKYGLPKKKTAGGAEIQYGFSEEGYDFYNPVKNNSKLF